MEGYLKKGQTLFTDNWYTSPLLSTYLHKKTVVGLSDKLEEESQSSKINLKLVKHKVYILLKC